MMAGYLSFGVCWATSSAAVTHFQRMYSLNGGGAVLSVTRDAVTGQVLNVSTVDEAGTLFYTFIRSCAGCARSTPVAVGFPTCDLAPVRLSGVSVSDYADLFVSVFSVFVVAGGISLVARFVDKFRV